MQTARTKCREQPLGNHRSNVYEAISAVALAVGMVSRVGGQAVPAVQNLPNWSRITGSCATHVEAPVAY
jgi:hypothetical protein